MYIVLMWGLLLLLLENGLITPKKIFRYLLYVVFYMILEKILIPDEILSKPCRLTDNEFAIMKNHVNLGYSQMVVLVR
jgi:hypothetical protein